MNSARLADLRSLLCCPDCGASLQEGDEGYRCSACQRDFPVVRGVARFVHAQNYADNFGYQWQVFSRTQLLPEYAERHFRRKTGLTESDLHGKVVLDVGCGMGRFAEVATRWGAKVIGVDLSAAAEVAARNLTDRNFTALQADIFALPFVPGSFDCIYSVGVLHHTPDCEKAFKILPQFLKPGGSIAVWLYSGYNNWYRFSDQYRKITHRISPRRLHGFFRIAVPSLYWLDRGVQSVPLVGPSISGLLRHVFPVNRNPNPQIRILDTLDWYSPKYQSKHTYEQVFRWFESCGLENLTVGGVPISVKGQKPHSGRMDGLPRVWLREIVTSSGNDRSAHTAVRPTVTNGFSPAKKAVRTLRWFPAYAWQRFTRRLPYGHTHVMIAVADHFEPAIVPNDGSARALLSEQKRRLESWCREYPLVFDCLRDTEGHPFVHSYFYPAEQYDKDLLELLADHCTNNWGEIEVHLHHGRYVPDTEQNLRRQLLDFRNELAFKHNALCYLDGVGPPRYAFVHGNFALANSAGGRNCGVDSEMQVLAETGCYGDFTLPPGLYHRTHIAKINSLYECSSPLWRGGAHRKGRDLEVGHRPGTFPLMVEGPLMLSFVRADGKRTVRVENGSLTATNPPTLYRFGLWKQSAIRVKGRPDWIFIKLQCHGMDPRDREVMLGAAICRFLRQLLDDAPQRSETIHFVTAREMVNIMLAACDGRDGNPGEYRDYRLKPSRAMLGESRLDYAAGKALKN